MKSFFKRHICYFSRSNIMLRYGVGWSYAEWNGGLVLKGQTSWRKINGVWINAHRWQLWLLFRRAL